MNNEYSLMTYSLLELFSIYTVYRFMRIFHEDRIWGEKVEFITYSIYFVINILFYVFAGIPIILFLGNIFFMFLITFNYDSLMRKRILSVIFICMILMITDTMVALLVQYPYLSPLSKSKDFPLFCHITVRIFCFLIMLLMSKCKNIKKNIMLSRIYWICIIMIPSITILCVIYLPIDVMTLNQATFFTAAILFINFSVFYLFDRLLLQAKTAMDEMLTENEQKAFWKQMEVYQYRLDNQRKMRHDINNRITILKMYMDQNQYDEASQYLDTYLLDLFEEKERVDCGIPILDSILNQKIEEAECKGIYMEITVTVPYELELDSSDMIIVLGSLLNHAIEETQVSVQPEKQIMVNINFKFVRGRFIIEITYPHSERVNLPDAVSQVIKKYNGFIKEEQLDDKIKMKATLHMNIEKYLD